MKARITFRADKAADTEAWALLNQQRPMCREVLPACRRGLVCAWSLRAILAITVALAGVQVGQGIAERRQAAIETLPMPPWPCEYDRGAYFACSGRNAYAPRVR